MENQTIQAPAPKKKDLSHYVLCLTGFFFLFGFGLLPPIAPLTPVGMQILGIFIGVVFMWSTVGIIWPSILGIVAFGMSDYCTMNQAITSSLGNPVIWQVLMILIIAGAITESGVGEYIARWLISKKFVNGRPLLFCTVFLYGFFITSAITNSFAAIFLSWAVLYSIADMVGYQKGDKYMTIMLLFSTIAGALGDFVIPFKGWQIALCAAFSQASGTDLSYVQYIAFAIILGSLMILALSLSIKFVFRVDMSKIKSFDASRLSNAENVKLNYKQKAYFSTFLLVIASTVATTVLPAEWWIVQLFSRLTGGGVFALAVVILCFVKVNGEPLLDFNRAVIAGVKWECIFICAAAIPIANALTSAETGFTTLCAQFIQPMVAGKGVFAIIAIIILVDLVLTNFGSNTGIAMLLIPLAIPLCQQFQISTSLMGILIIYTASMGFILPGASAVSAVLYGNNWLRPKQIIGYTSFACLVYLLLALPFFYCASLL